MSARRPPRWRRILKAFDERGATYAAIADRPGWFVVEWLQDDGEPWQQVYHPGMQRRQQMMRVIARRAAGKVVTI